MAEDSIKPLIIEGIDITHSRLVDLTQLADQAAAFYDWATTEFQTVLKRKDSLDQILRTASLNDIKRGIAVCYEASGEDNLPLLFDGVGRTYPHAKACYYFFSWIIRDAPQQRLAPLITRITKMSKRARAEVKVHVLASLICKYRRNVKTFSWEPIREIIIDRLEGSRRSIRGHEKETVVRTALIAAIQGFYKRYSNYGVYAGVQILDKQVTIGKETIDVSARLFNEQKEVSHRILVPVKTRETEGGGHAHLFTRDIMSAINAARVDNPNNYLIAVIVAKNWSEREAQLIREKVDHAVIFDLSPNDFSIFSDEEQERLNSFITSVLNGSFKRQEQAE